MDDLCTACLCGGRNLYFINETGSYNIYRDILNEVPMYETPEICVRICWECRARLSRYQEFKTQVQLSYRELKEYVEKKLHKLTLMRPSHLQIQQVDSFSYPKDAIKVEKNDVDIEIDIKSEVELETHCEPEAFVNDLQVAGEGSTKKRNNHEKTIKKKVRKRRKIKSKKKAVSSDSSTHLDRDRSEALSDLESVVDYCEDVEGVSETVIPEERDGAEEGKSKTDVTVEPVKANGVTEKKLVIANHDANEKPQCVECGKMFSSRKTYRYHLNVLHKGQNRYPCPRCGKVYQWKSNLGRHMRSHKARDSGELYCDTCDKRFASVATYRQHLKISRRHVSENEFTFICNECGKKFVNKTRLRDHIDWEHLNKIKFRCQLCNKPFKCHTSLYVHEQNVHKNKEKKDNLCHVCGKSYQNAAKLKYHIVAMHTSETPYRCPQCAAAFGWYSSLYRHLREVHYKMKLQPKKSKKSKKPPNEVLPSLIPTQQIVLPALHATGPPQM